MKLGEITLKAHLTTNFSGEDEYPRIMTRVTRPHLISVTQTGKIGNSYMVTGDWIYIRLPRLQPVYQVEVSLFARRIKIYNFNMIEILRKVVE